MAVVPIDETPLNRAPAGIIREAMLVVVRACWRNAREANVRRATQSSRAARRRRDTDKRGDLNRRLTCAWYRLLRLRARRPVRYTSEAAQARPPTAGGRPAVGR